MTNLKAGIWIFTYNSYTKEFRGQQQVVEVRTNDIDNYNEAVTEESEAYKIIPENNKYYNTGNPCYYAVLAPTSLHPIITPALSDSAYLDIMRETLKFYKESLSLLTEEQLAIILQLYRTEFNSGEKITVEVVVPKNNGSFTGIDEFVCINPGDHSEYHFQYDTIPDFHKQCLNQRIEQLEEIYGIKTKRPLGIIHIVD